MEFPSLMIKLNKGPGHKGKAGLWKVGTARISLAYKKMKDCWGGTRWYFSDQCFGGAAWKLSYSLPPMNSLDSCNWGQRSEVTLTSHRSLHWENKISSALRGSAWHLEQLITWEWGCPAWIFVWKGQRLMPLWHIKRLVVMSTLMRFSNEYIKGNNGGTIAFYVS